LNPGGSSSYSAVTFRNEKKVIGTFRMVCCIPPYSALIIVLLRKSKVRNVQKKSNSAGGVFGSNVRVKSDVGKLNVCGDK